VELDIGIERQKPRLRESSTFEGSATSTITMAPRRPSYSVKYTASGFISAKNALDGFAALAVADGRVKWFMGQFHVDQTSHHGLLCEGSPLLCRKGVEYRALSQPSTPRGGTAITGLRRRVGQRAR
jgi:hypothetical protein